MVTRIAERIACRHALVGAALRVLAAEHGLSDDDASVTSLAEAEEAMELAARDLTNCVNDMPPLERPKGWTLAGQDGAP